MSRNFIAVAILTTFLIGFPVARVGAQDAIAISDPPLAIGAGEIRLQGVIQSVDTTAKTIVFVASSFATPGGKSAPIAPPKSKSAQLSAATQLFRRGKPDAALALEKLKVGYFLLVVGKDGGAGRALQVRALSVWKTEHDGEFTLEEDKPAPKTDAAAPDKGASDAATPKAATPKATKRKPVLKNEIENGDFETIGDDLQLAGWIVPRSPGVQIIEGNDGNYVLFKPLGEGNARKIIKPFEIKPGWKTLKISARVRGKDLKAGTDDWATAHIGLVYFDVENKNLGYAWPITLNADSDWKEMNGSSVIPPGTHHAELDVANFGTEGEFGVDDLAVEPNGALDVPLLRPDFPEGNFDELDENEQPVGWPTKGVANVRVENEDGNNFLRLSNDKENGYTGIQTSWKLEPGTRRVRVQAKLRGHDLKPGKETWQTARVGLAFTDATGAVTGGWPASLELHADADWTLVEQMLEVPATAAILTLTPQLLNARGSLDVDDIQIEQLR